MKVKTSVTLSSEILREIDKSGSECKSRSEFIEMAIRAYLKKERERRDVRDLALINKHADALNKEAEDALSYQVKR